VPGTETEDQLDEGGEEQLTDEQKQAKELEDARARLRKFEAFAPFVEKLEADPTKIFDVRAALDGKSQQQPAQPQQPAQQPNPQLNQAQLKELNEKLKAAALDPDADFLGFVAGISGEISKAQLAEFQKNTQPYLESAAEAFIDRFKTRWEKGVDDPELFKRAEKIFDEDLAKVNPQDLLGLDPARRDYELSLRRDAAIGRVMSSGYTVNRSGNRNVAASAARGTSIGSSQRKVSEKVVELTEHEKAVLERHLGKDGAAKAIEDIEAGR
jgi:hypothetical protein